MVRLPVRLITPPDLRVTTQTVTDWLFGRRSPIAEQVLNLQDLLKSKKAGKQYRPRNEQNFAV